MEKKPVFLDPAIWGPPYWFFLHTIAQTYPTHPNEVIKRKYYDLIMNMPLFIPDPKMGDRFAEMVDRHPVTPYLDSRDSFIRWVHYIHNKYNLLLGKEEITLLESLDKYHALYQPQTVRLSESWRLQKKYIVIGVILSLVLLIYVFYKE